MDSTTNTVAEFNIQLWEGIHYKRKYSQENNGQESKETKLILDYIISTLLMPNKFVFWRNWAENFIFMDVFAV